jgi:hypothetical protein
MKFKNISATMDEILSSQRSQFSKTILCYSEKKEVANEEASTSSKQSSEGNKKS